MKKTARLRAVRQNERHFLQCSQVKRLTDYLADAVEKALGGKGNDPSGTSGEPVYSSSPCFTSRNPIDGAL